MDTAIQPSEFELILSQIKDAPEPPCESHHEANDNLVCSGSVTIHVFTKCGSRDHLLCENAHRAILNRITETALCRKCGAKCKDDWVILPA